MSIIDFKTTYWIMKITKTVLSQVKTRVKRFANTYTYTDQEKHKAAAEAVVKKIESLSVDDINKTLSSTNQSGS